MTVGSRVKARHERLFLAFESNCLKLNTDRPIPYKLSCSPLTLVSGNVKFMLLFAGVL